MCHKNNPASKTDGPDSSPRFGELRPARPDGNPSARDKPILNDAESPLAWLRARRDKAGRPLISNEQYLAGEKLRFDYERSMLQQRVTQSWDMSSVSRSGGNVSTELSDGAYAARQKYQAALDAVGPELASMLVQVCCLSAGIEQAERLLELPQRSGKAVLGLALTGLARHYGLLNGQVSTRRGRVEKWAMADYRPRVPVAEDA